MHKSKKEHLHYKHETSKIIIQINVLYIYFYVINLNTLLYGSNAFFASMDASPLHFCPPNLKLSVMTHLYKSSDPNLGQWEYNRWCK